MEPQASGPFAFGPFVFDPAAGELRRDGVLVPGLGRRGTALLATLLGAKGEPVGKDELLAQAWPGQIVEEANLSVQIAALRKSLGTADNGAQWIATVPGVGYRFLRTIAADPVAAGSARPSIAVLPFESLSADPEHGYFADGIVEDLITALSRFRGFAVASRSASYAVPRGDPAKTAEALGVRYLVEGSVRRRGEALRVAVHLIDSAENRTLWSEQFDGALSGLFDFQDRVIAEIVGRAEPEVRRAEIERARRKRPESLDAYDLYLRALPLFRLTATDARKEAIRLLESSVALDPNFATGLAQLAWAYERQDTFGGGGTPEERARGVEIAERAATLGNDDPQVVAIAALVLAHIAGQRQRGLAMLADALHANPNNPTVLMLYAFTNVVRGDLKAGRAAFLRALEIAPGALDNYELLVGIGLSYLFDHDYEGAIEWSQKSLAANNEWIGAYWTLAAAQAHLGHLEEARATVGRLLTKAPGMRFSDVARVVARDPGRDVLILDGLRKAGMPD
jgi:TolB-like protein